MAQAGGLTTRSQTHEHTSRRLAVIPRTRCLHWRNPDGDPMTNYVHVYVCAGWVLSWGLILTAMVMK